MAERAKDPRLHWHKSRANWVIRDTGRPEVATGTADCGDAEKRVAPRGTGHKAPVLPMQSRSGKS